MNKVTGIVLLVLIIVAGAIWYGFSRKEDEADRNEPVLSVSAFNETKNTEASQAAAQPSDTIAFTLKAENPTAEVIPGYVLQADISNVANASTLVDAGGASFNSANNTLVWTPLDIGPNQSIESKFVVRVNDLPAGATTANMSIRYNNEVVIAVSKSAVAGAETTNTVPAARDPYNAPTSGTSEMLVLGLAMISTFGAFMARKRLKLS